MLLDPDLLLLFLYKQNMGFPPLQSQSPLNFLSSSPLSSNACSFNKSFSSSFFQYLLISLLKLSVLLFLLFYWCTKSGTSCMERNIKQFQWCFEILECFRQKSLQLVWHTLQFQWSNCEYKSQISKFTRTIAFKFSAPQILEHPCSFICQSQWSNPKRVWRLSWA